MIRTEHYIQCHTCTERATTKEVTKLRLYTMDGAAVMSDIYLCPGCAARLVRPLVQERNAMLDTRTHSG